MPLPVPLPSKTKHHLYTGQNRKERGKPFTCSSKEEVTMKEAFASMKKFSVDNRPVGGHVLTLASLSIILVAVTHTHSVLCLANYSHTAPLPSSSDTHLPSSSMCHDLITFSLFYCVSSPFIFTAPGPHTPHCSNALQPWGSIYIFSLTLWSVLERPENRWTAS